MNDTLPSNLPHHSDLTLGQYRTVLSHAKSLFLKKAADYGTSWRVLRPISIVDQIYIKAWRIRQIQETGKQMIDDSIESEFTGIINYGIIALIQDQNKLDEAWEWPLSQTTEWYERMAQITEDLMLQKNHDYGEAWREMCEASFVDMILVKLLRIRQIIANDGKLQVSEGADANFMDIVNYAVFALITKQEEMVNVSP